VKRFLFVLIALIVAFVGWRLATWPGLEPEVELAASMQPARLVAEQLPVLEAQRDQDVRSAVATDGDAPARATTGVLADRELVLEARCVDLDGNPLAGVEVVASQAGLESSGESDEDGRVRIERNVAWVDWALSIESFVLGRKRRSVELFEEGQMQVRVVARRSGYAAAETWPQMILGEVVQAGELVLVPAGSLAGRVVDSSGLPVAGASVGVGVVRLAQAPRPEVARRSDPRRIETATDESGRFLFEDAAAGVVVLDARDSTGRSGELRRVDVRAGESTEVEIVLAASSPPPSIHGRVISSAGDPVARAVVVARSVGAGSAYQVRLTSDERGAFLLPPSGDGHVSVEAWDSHGAHGFARAEDVAPGTDDLVLRLDEVRTLALDVVRADGAELGDFSATVYVQQAEGRFDRGFVAITRGIESANIQYTNLDVEGGRTGPHPVAIPRAPFAVRVASSGLHPQTLGPFEPDRAPEVVRVELTQVRTLSGRVLRDGGPVAGAQVKCCVPLPRGETWLRDGFPSRFLVAPPFTRTDREGRFALHFELPDGTRLRAEAPGSAPTETAPIVYDGASTPIEVEIVLSRGGDLEGHVVVDVGRDPAGIIVGLTRGDGNARTQRTDRHGRFRFEYLMPGAWFVHEHETEIHPRMWGTSAQRFGPEHVWPTNAHVVEGRTTFLELDLREPPRLVVEGRALADGRALSGWSALLLADAYSTRTLQRERATATVGLDGRFELTVHEPGDYELRLRQDVDTEFARTIHASSRIDAPRSTWNCEFATGTLAGFAPQDGRRLHHQGLTAAGLFVCAPIDPDADGRFRVEGVLAGPGTIVVEPVDSAEIDRALWPVLREVAVPAGGVADIDMP